MRQRGSERYRIDAELGRGGMATVYAVTDMLGGRRVALKRLQPRDAGSLDTATTLFRREFQLLSDLSHPSIIQVYDYAVDDQGPYYTMELLEGQSLRTHVDIDHARLCRLLHDVASSLAVLHARRLVHRDVTPGNIQCTRDGRAKLLDFGAVTEMGVPSALVGTPPFLPPEALHLQPVDGRTDLYALGASLYRLLTGKHAYPATQLSELEALWRMRPPPPHELDPTIPETLSSLTMALLSLEPRLRPSSAAEVMSRLATLADQQIEEPFAVHRAYFARPALVGRARLLAKASKWLARAADGRGGTLMITGTEGSGRSRLLDACAMEARLAGLHVVRNYDRHAQRAYACVVDIGRSLIETLPDVARQAALNLNALAELFPDLCSALDLHATLDVHAAPEPATGDRRPASTHSETQRKTLQNAIRTWFLRMARLRPLFLAIDDVHQMDEPSAACFAALSTDLGAAPLLIAMASATDRPAHADAAVEWLHRTGIRLHVLNLTRHETLQLASAIFGDVPNVALVANRIYEVCKGHPRSAIQLAEHLIDRGSIRYEAGEWQLPDRLSVQALPASLEAALEAKLACLPTAALDLAQPFSLAQHSAFSSTEIAAACSTMQPAQVRTMLLALAEAGYLTREEGSFSLQHEAWIPAVHKVSDPGTREEWHKRLACMFERRGDGPRAAHHWVQAGDLSKAAACLVAHAEEADRDVLRDPDAMAKFLIALPPRYLDTLWQVVDHSAQLGLPPRINLLLRSVGVAVGTLSFDGSETAHLPRLLDDLASDCGLTEWKELDVASEPLQRALTALQLAQAAHEHAPAELRRLPPPMALRELARVLSQATAICSQTRSFDLWRSLPSLAPFAPISPGLAMVQALVENLGNVLGARYEQSIANYRQILEMLRGPAGDSVDGTTRQYIELSLCFAIGIIQSGIGIPECLTWAEKLERDPRFEVTAWQVRMCYHLTQGEAGRAEQCRRRAELLRIQNAPHQYLGTGTLFTELQVCASTNDLIGIKRLLLRIEPLAARFSGWRPTLARAQGELHRMRGDLEAALRCFETALSTAAAGTDVSWPHAASGYLAMLRRLGRRELAWERARELVHLAGEAQLGVAAIGVAGELALLEAERGDAGEGHALVDAKIERLEDMGGEGLSVGSAYEIKARLSLCTGNQAAFDAALARCEQHFRRGKEGGLRKRYEQLLDDAARVGWVRTHSRAPAPIRGAAVDHTVIQTLLAACAGPEERAARALDLISRQHAASSGMIYLTFRGNLHLRAVRGKARETSQLEAAVRRYLQRMIAAAAGHTITSENHSDKISADGTTYEMLLLADEQDGASRIAGVILLERRNGRQQPSWALLRNMAQHLIDAGDAQPITA